MTLDEIIVVGGILETMKPGDAIYLKDKDGGITGIRKNTEAEIEKYFPGREDKYYLAFTFAWKDADGTLTLDGGSICDAGSICSWCVNSTGEIEEAEPIEVDWFMDCR